MQGRQLFTINPLVKKGRKEMKLEVLSEQQAAEQLGVSVGTLYRWRKSGKVKHYRQMGRLIRYLPEDIANSMADFASSGPKPVTSQNVTEARFG